MDLFPKLFPNLLRFLLSTLRTVDKITADTNATHNANGEKTMLTINGLRWATDKLAGGEWHAYAYLAIGSVTEIASVVVAGTESESVAALRKEICKWARKPDQPLKNEKGWTI